MRFGRWISSSDQLFDGRKIRVLTIVDALFEGVAGDPRSRPLHWRGYGGDIDPGLSRPRLPEDDPRRQRPGIHLPRSRSLGLHKGRHARLFEGLASPPDPIALSRRSTGKFGPKCIDQNWFLSLADAQVKCEAFRHEYNTQRPQQDPDGVHEIDRSLQPAFVFAGRPQRPLSNVALAMLLRRMDLDVTAHGMRTSFRTWCSEVAHVEFELAELCLSHRVGSAVSRAYNRTTMTGAQAPGDASLGQLRDGQDQRQRRADQAGRGVIKIAITTEAFEAIAAQSGAIFLFSPFCDDA